MTMSPRRSVPSGKQSSLSQLDAALVQLQEALTKQRIAKERGRLERKLQAAMAKAFRAQGKAFIAQLGTVKGSYPIQEAAKWGSWADKFDAAAKKTIALFTGPIDSATTQAILIGAKAVIGTVKAGIAFDLKNKRAIAYLKANPAAQKVTGINETTKTYIRTVVDQAIEGGWSYNKLAEAITERFEQFAVGKPQEHIDSRASLVAVTEVGQAYCEGNLMAGRELQDAGVGMEKKWDDSGDGKVSQGCLENSGAGWIPLDDAFPSGDDRPLRFPGCRCDLLMRATGGDDV